MEAILLGLVTGLISGVVASIVFWFYMTHIVVPRINFSPKITRLPSTNTNNGVYYQFKFASLDKKTPAVDVHVRATIHYPDFPRDGTTNFYEIPIDADHIIELLPFPSAGRTARRVSLKITSDTLSKSHLTNFFPDSVRSSAGSQTLMLEDLLAITDGAFIRVYVSAAHGFSGAKKVFKKEYRSGDIFKGRFDVTSLDTKEEVPS